MIDVKNKILHKTVNRYLSETAPGLNADITLPILFNAENIMEGVCAPRGETNPLLPRWGVWDSSEPI